MPIVWQDGLDSYDADADMLANYSYYASTPPTFGSSTGRFGGGAAYCGANSATGSAMLCRGVPNSDLYHQFGGAVKFTALAGGSIGGARTSVGSYDDIATQIHCKIAVTSAGEIQIYNDAATLVATSATGVITLNTWKYLEVRIYRHATAGSVEVFIGGVSVVSATSIDTIDTSSTVIVGFWNRGSLTDENLFYVDDFYVASGSSFDTAVGDRRIGSLAVNADTAQADLSLSTGSSGYQLLDDTGGGNGDTDYIYSTTVGHISDFDFADLSGSPTIHAVAVKLRASKTDAGSKTLRARIKSSSSVANGSTFDPGIGYSQHTDIFLVDPATSSAWTASGVNAALVGVEIVS